jgi:hypothetical protein
LFPSIGGCFTIFCGSITIADMGRARIIVVVGCCVGLFDIEVCSTFLVSGIAVLVSGIADYGGGFPIFFIFLFIALEFSSQFFLSRISFSWTLASNLPSGLTGHLFDKNEFIRKRWQNSLGSSVGVQSGRVGHVPLYALPLFPRTQIKRQG